MSSFADQLELVSKLGKLIKIGEDVRMSQLSPAHVVTIFTDVFGASISSDDAIAMAEGLRGKSANPEQSLADFFRNGGFLKMFEPSKDIDANNIVVCPECGCIIP